MKSRQIFFENLVAQNALGGIPENYDFSGKTLYEIFQDLFSGSSFTEINLESNTGLEFNPSSELRTKYNTLITDENLSQKIGNLNPKSASVWKTKSIVEVLDEILFPANLPTYTIPTIVLTDSLGPIQEVGTVITNNFTLTGTKNDAGDFTSLRILEGATEITDSSPSPGPSATLSYSHTFQVDPGVTTWTGKGSYNQGDRKSDSQGVEDTRNYAIRQQNAPQAADSDFTSNSTSIDGIYPFFYGVFSSSTPPTPEQIKGFIEAGNGNKTLTKADGTISIQFNGTVQYLWFAHAEIYPTKTKWQAANNPSNGGNIGAPSDFFGAHSIQEIISPDSYWTVDYKIYVTTGRTSTQDNGVQYIINLKNDNIFVSFEGKLLDAKWGPFPDTDAAYTAVDPVYRQIGMFAIINSPSGAQLWWYKNDINTLVPFSGNSSVQVYDVKDESEPSVPGETFFPLTGNLDVIYVDKSTSSSYYWNTSTTPPEYTLTGSGEGFVEVYPSKTGSTPGTDSFPTVGTVNVIYIADDTNISYLWNTALLSGNGDYEIIVGGTIPTLQEVLSKNNTATDKDILLNGTSKVQFENGSKVQKGTTDAGIGGNGGVALKCSMS
jgi:hypothetical protein